MSDNVTSTPRTRHVDARWWFVNDLQDQGLIKVEFVSTHDNIADIGTKNVQGDVLDTHSSRLMIERPRGKDMA